MLPETTHDVVESSGTFMRNTRVPVQNLISTTIEDAYSPFVTDTSTVETPSVSRRVEWLSRSFSSDYVPLELKNRAHRLVQPLQLLAVPQVLVMVYIFLLSFSRDMYATVPAPAAVAPTPAAPAPLCLSFVSTGVDRVLSATSSILTPEGVPDAKVLY